MHEYNFTRTSNVLLALVAHGMATHLLPPLYLCTSVQTQSTVLQPSNVLLPLIVTKLTTGN